MAEPAETAQDLVHRYLSMAWAGPGELHRYLLAVPQLQWNAFVDTARVAFSSPMPGPRAEAFGVRAVGHDLYADRRRQAADLYVRWQVFREVIRERGR